MLNNKVLLLSLLSIVSLKADGELVLFSPDQQLATYSKEDRIVAKSEANQQLQTISNFTAVKNLKDIYKITNKFCMTVFQADQMEVIEELNLEEITRDLFNSEIENMQSEGKKFDKFEIGQALFKVWSKTCNNLKKDLKEGFFNKKSLMRQTVKVIQLEMLLFFTAKYQPSFE